MRTVSLVAGLAAMLFAHTTSAAPVSSEIEAPGPLGPLKGTLTMPASDAPVVLILPGSGPTDRDGNNPAGVAGAPYRLLAEGLAARGIGTLRIDKRGLFASHAAIADPNAVTIPDYVNDTRAWIAAARAKTGARCIWLLGHSEGGLIALATAGQAPDLCGLILVAAPGHTLGDVLRRQIFANSANGPILTPAITTIDWLERGKRVSTRSMNPALAQLFRPEIQGFLISAFSYDPTKLIAAVRVPVAIVQGTRDLQVTVDDARRLAKAKPDARLLLLRDTNHVLKTVTSNDPGANLATYGNPSLPLAPYVVPQIAAFIAPSAAPR